MGTTYQTDVMGDLQRLANGNIVIAFGGKGIIQEIKPRRNRPAGDADDRPTSATSRSARRSTVRRRGDGREAQRCERLKRLAVAALVIGRPPRPAPTARFPLGKRCWSRLTARRRSSSSPTSASSCPRTAAQPGPGRASRTRTRSACSTSSGPAPAAAAVRGREPARRLFRRRDLQLADRRRASRRSVGDRRLPRPDERGSRGRDRRRQQRLRRCSNRRTAGTTFGSMLYQASGGDIVEQRRDRPVGSPHRLPRAASTRISSPKLARTDDGGAHWTVNDLSADLGAGSGADHRGRSERCRHRPPALVVGATAARRSP